MNELGRRKVRYHCFRLRTEAEGGVAADVPEGFSEHFENHPFWANAPFGFHGWKMFGETWDVSETDQWQPVLRKFSIHQEWNATLRQVVPELPSREE